MKSIFQKAELLLLPRIGLQICIAWYLKRRAVKHEIGNSGRNSLILNAKFVKSWILVASRRILKVLSCLRFDSSWQDFFPARNFIVFLLLSDVDKLLLWIVDFFYSIFLSSRKLLFFVSNNKSDKLVIQFSHVVVSSKYFFIEVNILR